MSDNTARVTVYFEMVQLNKIFIKVMLLISFLSINACSNLPINIQNPPKVDIQLQQVLKHSASYENMPIRWGGTIISVENAAEETQLQILIYPLNYYGRPKTTKPANGRFMAISKLFLDPAIYSNGRELTIAGRIQGSLEKKIGEKSITLPIISIDNHHIWPQYQPNYYRYNAFSPYYYNYGVRYYPYPYFRRRYSYGACY